MSDRFSGVVWMRRSQQCLPAARQPELGCRMPFFFLDNAGWWCGFLRRYLFINPNTLARPTD